MVMKTLSVENVSKSYNGHTVVSNLSFNVSGGEMFGLLGPNGAGKTTTIRMIMNIIYPDSGTISIYGEKLNESTKEKIGYLPEERGMYKRMKVMDILVYFGMLKNMKRQEARQEARRFLSTFDMLDCEKKKIEELSRGMQQKIQFITTILHRPDLIILDEPFSGLDPINRKLIKDTMEDLRKQGKTIIFSTHQMDEVERLCDDILLINRGECVLSGNLAEIKKNYGKSSIMVTYEGDVSFLRGLPGVVSIDDYGKYAEISIDKTTSPSRILRELAGRVEISRFELSEPTLNKIFIDAVGGTVE
jgi:ABC-2 type transport system ATP-binding protein